MDPIDVQIEVALLASVERQAKKTAAALERVRELMHEVAEIGKRGLRTSDFGLKKIQKSEVCSRKSKTKRRKAQ